jgi:hypothetical protein
VESIVLKYTWHPTTLSIINILYQSGIFHITDKHTLTQHHPGSTVQLRFPHGVLHSLGLKCIITCTHYYSIIQSNFTALEVLYIVVDFLKMLLDYFALASAAYESSSSSTFLPTLGMKSLILAIVIGVMRSQCGFNLYFPNAS